jgi:hypothetical protein
MNRCDILYNDPVSDRASFREFMDHDALVTMDNTMQANRFNHAINHNWINLAKTT